MNLLTQVQETSKQNPKTIALRAGKDQITYQQLDLLSSQLANDLKKRGFREGQRAAIAVDKSIASVVAMLAVLKARGIYIPIDVQQPKQRVKYILENAQAAVVFCTDNILRNWEQEFPQSVAHIVVFASLAAHAWRIKTTTNEVPEETISGNPEDLAFILYTSGSTGVPKGVKISHTNAQVFIDWCLQEMSFSPQDTFLNLAGFHFDLSVFDIYVALSSGATLVITSPSVSGNPFQVARLIEENQATVVYCVPSILTMIATSQAIDKYDLSSIRYLLFAGEVFPIKYLKMFRKLLPEAQLYNLYGPTETNVCTYYKVEDIAEDRTEAVPIGKAVSGAKIWACNEQGEPLQAGEIGELLVKGPCVTPGYWNYFDENNHSNHQQGIHATGDLVSLEGDNYVFRGRKDSQVKLRGYRIELQEIEKVIWQFPGVKECKVLIEGQSGKEQIAAYLSSTKDISLLELRRHCSEHLPQYMIPGNFEILSELPKNANGKIDKLQLSMKG